MTLYTVAEVQRMLKISRGRAYELLSTGQIPDVRIGKLLRVRGADLEAYLESCRLPRLGATPHCSR
jgi:excisionase family DNA binding protein